MIKLIKDNLIKFILLCCCFILDIFVIVLALTPSNKDITAPGGLNEVKSVIEADTNVSLEGSFNTIYVYSIDRASKLQAFVASLANYNEVSDSPTDFHLSKEENKKAGEVQKNQSIEASLICAYRYAKSINSNISIEYHLKGFIIRNYQVNNKLFEIGDIIFEIYDCQNDEILTIDNQSDLEKIARKLNPNYLNIGDKVKFLRDGKIHEKEIKDSFDYENKQNFFYVYAKYEIVEENTFPKYTLHKSNTLGPSGGLLQTLSVFSQITGIDLTYGKKIAGTGTIDVAGNVGKIGGVSQKIVTAIHNGADVFLCPEANYDEAYKTYIKTKGHDNMVLIKVSTFEEAVKSLGELYGN